MAAETRRQGDAVGGAYAITGTLPTIADVVAFKESTATFDHGYYRFVSHPHLRRLEAELKTRFQCRHCRLAESYQTALLELILCLHPTGRPGRIFVLGSFPEATALADGRFLPACEGDGLSIMTLQDPSRVPADLGRQDILVLGPGADAGPTARIAREHGASVVAAIPTPLSEPPEAQFFVLGLSDVDGGALGGAVLGNADRVMDRLAEQMKRRGPVLSSRVAERLLAGAATGMTGAHTEANARVAETLCRMEGGSRAFLYASGMSAITRVLDLLRAPGKRQIVAVGHLYNDTYQTLRIGETVFLGVAELERLGDAVGSETAAILTETITNPLSDVPDLRLLSRVAHDRGVPLIVDNTIATPINCRPFEIGADYVIHSTTKYLNGTNDHGGGAVIVRDERRARELAERQMLMRDHMSPREAAVLETNLSSVSGRMSRFNANALRIAEFLAGHPGVRRVFYCGLPTHRSHSVARDLLQGFGSVVSFTLREESLDGLRAFYDSPLDGIRKAPSLGSNVTLLCPYTMLTHYADSDEELAEIGLPRFLARISVGCEEECAPIMESLDQALRATVQRG